MKSDSYCVGGRRRSSTTNIYDDTTSKGSKVLIGFCSVCNRKKHMIVSDNTIQSEGFGVFFKNLVKGGLNVSKKMAKSALKTPSQFLGPTTDVATSTASRSPEKVRSSLPEMINFYHMVKCLYLGKFV